MKFGKRDNLERVKSIILIPAETEDEQDVVVTINSLPVGYTDLIQKEIPKPIAPLKPVRDPKTKKFKIVPNTSPPEVELAPDTEDPEYVAAKEDHEGKTTAWFLFNGTRHDKLIKWETNPEGMSKPDFYAAIYREIVEVGLGIGYVSKIIENIMTLSGMDKKKLAEARQAFLAQRG